MGGGDWGGLGTEPIANGGSHAAMWGTWEVGRLHFYRWVCIDQWVCRLHHGGHGGQAPCGSIHSIVWRLIDSSGQPCRGAMIAMYTAAVPSHLDAWQLDLVLFDEPVQMMDEVLLGA